MAENSKIHAITVPLVQTIIVSKLTWGEADFTFVALGQEDTVTVDAKRFISAHRLDPERIALTYIARFKWQAPQQANRVSVNGWLDRWDRRGQNPIFLRKVSVGKKKK